MTSGTIPKIICHAASIEGASCILRAFSKTLENAALAAPIVIPSPPRNASQPLKLSSRAQIKRDAKMATERAERDAASATVHRAASNARRSFQRSESTPE